MSLIERLKRGVVPRDARRPSFSPIDLISTESDTSQGARQGCLCNRSAGNRAGRKAKGFSEPKTLEHHRSGILYLGREHGFHALGRIGGRSHRLV